MHDASTPALDLQRMAEALRSYRLSGDEMPAHGPAASLGAAGSMGAVKPTPASGPASAAPAPAEPAPHQLIFEQHVPGTGHAAESGHAPSAGPSAESALGAEAAPLAKTTQKSPTTAADPQTAAAGSEPKPGERDAASPAGPPASGDTDAHSPVRRR